MPDAPPAPRFGRILHSVNRAQPITPNAEVLAKGHEMGWGDPRFTRGGPEFQLASYGTGFGTFVAWSPVTGAHSVYGAIGSRFFLHQGRAPLGMPVTDEVDFFGGGRVSYFQGGAIYWWPDTGAIELMKNEVVLHYTGLHCFAETDEFSASNEPYSAIGVISPDGTNAISTRIYEDVDSGEDVLDLVEIYRGKPNGVTITCLLMENDEGDPNKYREVVKSAIDQGFNTVKPVLAQVPYVGPILAVVGPPLLDKLAPVVTDAVNGLLGTGDDKIGEATIYLSPKDLIVRAVLMGNQQFNSIGFKAETPFLNGDGGSYKAYFGIVPG